MKILNILLLLFCSIVAVAQNQYQDFNQIQKFIESTVQIPFMAKVADVQGKVTVRITVDDNGLPVSHEIVTGLREDCDKEALRVTKLINARVLNAELNGKRKLLVEVPFFNDKQIIFQKGEVIEYYGKDFKQTFNDKEIKYLAKYTVDSSTGDLLSNVFYYMVTKKDYEPIGRAFRRVDSLDRYHPEILESPQDTLKEYYTIAPTNSEFPNIYNNHFANGQTIRKKVGSNIYTYYPNGRIKLEEIINLNGKVNHELIYKWFANGQLAYIREINRKRDGVEEKFIAVWDTLGRQIVKDGNGQDEYYEIRNNKVLVISGLLNNGYKEGKWIGKYTDGELYFRENYQKNKCLGGVSFDGKDSVTYVNPHEPAEFKGGMQGFGMFLQGTLKYPSAAQRANVSGQVHTSFDICTDGTLCDYQILKSVGFGCDEEALRVIKLSSGKWKPSKERGRLVKAKFTLPITFQLTP
ncbi:MAG: energy transducer TonB [Arcicella sp.]|jgi:TonB family protein|nr:energy transducer TonB [Arcicella sp.]